MPKLMKKGGKSSFPDLNNDGKVSFADILAGRLRKKKKKSMDNGGQVEPLVRTERPKNAPDPMRRKGIVFASTSEPMSKEERDRAKRFLQGTNLDTAIRVPGLVYGEDSRGVMDPELYRDMSPEEFARLRDRGVEIGATIDDFYDDFYREGQMRQPLMSEDDPRFVRKVYNVGMGPDRPAEFEYYDQDKGKKLIQNYGGKVKLMKKGGEVEYGIGGAILGGINALREGKGLGGAAMAAGKGFVTPGSGIAQGAKLAGGLLAGSQNPALAGIGKVAGMASNFLPGGGGPAGALGQLMQMRQAQMGMMVPRRQMMGR